MLQSWSNDLDAFLLSHQKLESDLGRSCAEPNFTGTAPVMGIRLGNSSFFGSKRSGSLSISNEQNRPNQLWFLLIID